MSIKWNSEQPILIKPVDYEIHTYTMTVQGVEGENVLEIAGQGTSDGQGMTVANFRLMKAKSTLLHLREALEYL